MYAVSRDTFISELYTISYPMCVSVGPGFIYVTKVVLLLSVYECHRDAYELLRQQTHKYLSVQP